MGGKKNNSAADSTETGPGVTPPAPVMAPIEEHPEYQKLCEQYPGWVPFPEAPAPRGHRFIYCRRLESGSKVSAFAEVTESASGPGLFVDGVSGVVPMPSEEGHWWKLDDFPE